MNKFPLIKDTILSTTATLTDKTDAVINCWDILSKNYASKTVETFCEVFEHLYAATIEIILKGEWFEAIKLNNYKNGDDLKNGLLLPLKSIIDEAVDEFPRQCKLCVNLIPFLDNNPWSVDYIDGIVRSKDLPDPKVVEKLWEQENKHMLEMRLECLCSMKMYSQAFNIAQVCYLEIKKIQEGRSEIGDHARNMFCDRKFSDEITNIFYLLLCRLKSNTAIEKYLDVAEAVEVVSRLTGDAPSCRIAQKWKEWKKACKTIINVTAESILSQGVEQIDVNLVKVVYFHWIKHAGQDDEEIQRAKELLDRIDKIKTDHLYAFADVIVENFGKRLDSMQKALELYIRAMSYDINQIEKLDVTTNQSDLKISSKNKLAQRYLHLSTLFSHNEQISWELTLTAFSLSPSQHLFNKLFSHGEESTNEVLPDHGSGAEEIRTGSNKSHINLDSNIILTTALSEDLQTVIQNPRWKSLCWAKDKLELENLCRQQLDTGGPKIKAKEDLKHLHINYDEYEPRQSVNDYELDYGFEKGYEPKNFGIGNPRKRDRHTKSKVLKKIVPRKTYPSYPTAFNNRVRKKFGITRKSIPSNRVLKTPDSTHSGLNQSFERKQLSSAEAAGLAVSINHLQRFGRKKKIFTQVPDIVLSLELDTFLSLLPHPIPQSNIHRLDDISAEKIRTDGALDNKENILETNSTSHSPKFTRYTALQSICAAEHGELDVSSMNIPKFNGFDTLDLKRLEEANEISVSTSLQNVFSPSPATHSLQHSLRKTDLLHKLETDCYLTPIKFCPSTSPPFKLIDLNPVVVLEKVIPDDFIEDSAKSNALDVFVTSLRMSLKYLQHGCHNPSLSPTLTAAIEQCKQDNKKENPASVNIKYKVSCEIIPQIISEVCKHDTGSFKLSQQLLEEPICPLNYFRVRDESSNKNFPPITRKPGPKRITRKIYTQQMVQQAARNLKHNIKFKGQALGLEFVGGHIVRANTLTGNSGESNKTTVTAAQSVSSDSPLPSNPPLNCAPSSCFVQSSLSKEDLSISSVNLMRLDKYIVLKSIANIHFDYPQSDSTQQVESDTGHDIPIDVSTSLLGGMESEGVKEEAQLPRPHGLQNSDESQVQVPNIDAQFLSLASAGPCVNGKEKIVNPSSNDISPSGSESTEMLHQQNTQIATESSTSIACTASPSIFSNQQGIHLLPEVLPPIPEADWKISEFIYGDLQRTPYNRSPLEAGVESPTETNEYRKPLINNSTQRSRAGPRSKTKMKQPQSVPGTLDSVHSVQVDNDNENTESNPVVHELVDVICSDDDEYIQKAPALKKKKHLLWKYSQDQNSNSSDLERITIFNKYPENVAEQSVTRIDDDDYKVPEVFDPPTVVVVRPKHIEVDNDALENQSSYKEGNSYLNHYTGYFTPIEATESDLVFECIEDATAEDDNFWDLWPENDIFAAHEEETWESLYGGEINKDIDCLSNSVSDSDSSDDLSLLSSDDKYDSESADDHMGQPQTPQPPDQNLTDSQLLRMFQCKPCKVQISPAPQQVTNSGQNGVNTSSSPGKHTQDNFCSSDSETDRNFRNSDTLLPRKSKRVSAKLTAQPGSSDLQMQKLPHQSSDDHYNVSQKRTKRNISQKKTHKSYTKKSKSNRRTACPKSKKRCIYNDDPDESSSPNTFEIICLTDSEPEPDTVVEDKAEIGTKIHETSEDIGCSKSVVSEIKLQNSASSFESSPKKDESSVETNSELVSVSAKEIEIGWKKLNFTVEKINDDIIELSSGGECDEDPLSMEDPLCITAPGLEICFSNSNSSVINSEENHKANGILLSLDRSTEHSSHQSNQGTERIASDVKDQLTSLNEITSIVEYSQSSTNSSGKHVNAPVMEKVMQIHQKNPRKYIDDEPQVDSPCSFLNYEVLPSNSPSVFDKTSYSPTDSTEQLTVSPPVFDKISSPPSDSTEQLTVSPPVFYTTSSPPSDSTEQLTVSPPVFDTTSSPPTDSNEQLTVSPPVFDTTSSPPTDSNEQLTGPVGSMEGDDVGLTSVVLAQSATAESENGVVPVLSSVQGETIAHIIYPRGNGDGAPDVQMEESLTQVEIEDLSSYIDANSDEIKEQHALVEEKTDDDSEYTNLNLISEAEDQNVTSNNYEFNSVSSLANSCKKNFPETEKAVSGFSMERAIDISTEELDEEHHSLATCENNFSSTKNTNNSHNHSPIAYALMNFPTKSVLQNEMADIDQDYILISPERIPSFQVPEDPSNEIIELKKNDNCTCSYAVTVITDGQEPNACVEEQRGRKNILEGDSISCPASDTDVSADYHQSSIAKTENVIVFNTVENSTDDELETDEASECDIIANIRGAVESPRDDEDFSENSDEEDTISESGRSTLFSPDVSEHVDRLEITIDGGESSNTSRSPSPQEDLQEKTAQQQKEYICDWNLSPTIEQAQVDDQKGSVVQSQKSSRSSSEKIAIQENSFNQGKIVDSVCSSVQDKIQFNDKIILNSIQSNKLEYADEFPDDFTASRKAEHLLSITASSQNVDGESQPTTIKEIVGGTVANSVDYFTQSNNFQVTQSYPTTSDDGGRSNTGLKIVSTFPSASNLDEVQGSVTPVDEIEDVKEEVSSMMNYPESRNDENNCSFTIPRNEFESSTSAAITVVSPPSSSDEDVQSCINSSTENTNVTIDSIELCNNSDNQLCPSTSNEIVVVAEESSIGAMHVSPTNASRQEDGIAISSPRREFNDCHDEALVVTTSPNNISNRTILSCPIPSEEVQVREEYWDMVASSSKAKRLQDVQSCASSLSNVVGYIDESTMVVPSVDPRNHEDLPSPQTDRDKIESGSEGTKLVADSLHSDCKRDIQSFSANAYLIEGGIDRTIVVFPSTKQGNHSTIEACRDSSDDIKIDAKATQVGISPDHSVKIQPKRKRRRNFQTNWSKRRRTGRQRNIKLPSTCVQEAQDSVDHATDDEVIEVKNEEAKEFPASISIIKVEPDCQLGEGINNHCLHFMVEPTSCAFHQDADGDIKSVSCPCTLPNTDDVETDVDEDMEFVSHQWPDNSKRSLVVAAETLDVVIDKVDQPALHLDAAPSCNSVDENITKKEIIDIETVGGDNALVNNCPRQDRLMKLNHRRQHATTVPVKEHNTRKRRPPSSHTRTKATEKPVKPIRVRTLPVLKAEGKVVENENLYKSESNMEIQDSSGANQSQKSFQMPILLPAPLPLFSITPESPSPIGQPHMPSLFPAPSLACKSALFSAPVRGQCSDPGQISGALKAKKDEVKQIRKRGAISKQPRRAKKRKISSDLCRNEDLPPVLSAPDDNFESMSERDDPPILQPEIY